MKKTFLFLLLPVFSFANPPIKGETIKGHAQFKDAVHMVYLNYRNADKLVKDSSLLKEGRFEFKAAISEPTLATLYVRFVNTDENGRPKMDGMQIFMEPGTMQIEVKDSMKFAKIIGSKSQKDFETFNDLQKPFNDKASALNGQYMAFRKDKNEEGMKKVAEDFDKLTDERSEKVFHTYLNEHPQSPISLYVLRQYAGYDIDAQKVEPIFNKIPASIRKSASGIAFKKEMETSKKTGIGAMAMGFTQNDTLGKPVSLADFKGKYVLLDFWASWCGPCRAENPNVVKAFNQYKDKNFTVLSVSLDQPGKEQAWLDAIHKDGLTWTHVSDLKFWDNAVAKEYGIRAIPQNFLLDPTGKIIAKNIRGEELNKKLGEIFN
ncbi:MAG: TlpA disulfide reductase family protein [Ginsengibacter sp.]